MRRAILSACVGLATLMGIAATPRAASAGSMTYLALGDSVAFGETDFLHNPSYGDRGYVSLYANSLASQNGGARPNVVNLGIDGETSTSFFTGGQAATPLNLNYSGTSTSQNTAMIESIVAQQASGNTIGAITVSLGANDLFATVGKAGFFTESLAQQQADIAQTLAGVRNNYTALLTEIHALAPSAKVSLVGYYNPYPALPNNPITPLAGPAIQFLNAVIAGEAKAFGASYIDTYSAFVGNEATLTHILDPDANVHPNDAGYALIANAIETQSVPEPATVVMLGALAVGLFARKRIQRAA